VKDNKREEHSKLMAVMIEENISQIELGQQLEAKERKGYLKTLCKYIHIFAFSYKNMWDVNLEFYKIKFLSNAKLVRQKSY
jgi:hypothetical protein